MKSILPKYLEMFRNSGRLTITVSLLFTLLSILALISLPDLHTHYAFDQFLPKNHPLLKQDLELQKKYDLAENSPYLITLSPKPGSPVNWMATGWLSRLNELTNKINALPQVEKTVSLANIELAASDNQTFGTGTLFELHQRGSIRHLNLPWSLLSPQIISRDGRHTMIAVHPNTNLTSDDHENLVSTLSSQAQYHFSGLGIQIGGAPAITSEMNRLLSREILWFFLLSLLASLAVLTLVVKSRWILALAFGAVAFSNLFSLGLLAALGLSFTVLSTTVPVLITVTVVAIIAHTFVRLNESAKGETPVFPKVPEVLKDLALPHLLTALTTAVGFGTLIFSDSTLIQEYGLSVALAVLISWATTQACLVVILPRIPHFHTRDWRAMRLFLARRVIQHRELLLVGVLATCLLIGLNGKPMNWGAQLLDDLPADQPARISTEFINKNLGGIIPLEFSLKAPPTQHKYWLQPDVLHRMDQLLQRWRSKPEIASAVGLADWIRAGTGQGEIPATRKAIAEVKFLYGMSNSNPLRHTLTGSNDQTRLSLRLQDLPANRMSQLVNKLNSDLEAEFPGVIIQQGGWAATLPEVSRQLSNSLMVGFFQALFWIFLLLCGIFRSVRWALVAVLPNLVPGALLIGLLSLSQTPIKPGIAIIFAISLGIAFDNTVYILQRLRSRKKATGALPLQSILTREINPCLASSLSLLAGFSVFWFSTFAINQSFGLFMVLSLVAGLVGDLILLPAILGLFPGLLGSRPEPERPLAKVVPLFTKEAPAMVKKAAAIALLAIIGFSFSNSIEATKNLTAQEILSKVEKRLSTPNENMTLKMKISAADGTNKERTLRIKRKNTEQQQRALVKLLAPSELRGVSVLSVHEGEEENQWLYLPSAGQSRQITGPGISGRFLDSDFSYEDFRFSTYRDFSSKVESYEGEGRNKMAVILSTAKEDTETAYSQVRTWIHLYHFRIEKSEYYDKEGKILKVIKFNNYQAIHKKFWRARKVRVENLQTKSTTELELKTFSTHQLKESDFSLDAMKSL